MFLQFCSQQNDCLSPLIRGSIISVAMTNAEYLNAQPLDSGEWQNDLESVASTEEKNGSLPPELFDSFVFNCLGGGKASSVTDLDGHEGVIKLVEKLGDNYLFESSAVILIDNSRF